MQSAKQKDALGTLKTLERQLIKLQAKLLRIYVAMEEVKERVECVEQQRADLQLTCESLRHHLTKSEPTQDA